MINGDRGCNESLETPYRIIFETNSVYVFLEIFKITDRQGVYAVSQGDDQIPPYPKYRNIVGQTFQKNLVNIAFNRVPFINRVVVVIFTKNIDIIPAATN